MPKRQRKTIADERADRLKAEWMLDQLRPAISEMAPALIVKKSREVAALYRQMADLIDEIANLEEQQIQGPAVNAGNH